MSFENETDPPVTVDVLQRVKPGCEKAFEAILSDLIRAASSFEGHLGANVFRPSGNSPAEYRIVFKFDHLSSLKRWEASEMRQQLLERAKQLTVGASQTSVLTGLETWFTLPNRPGLAPPPRYKMFILTWATIFILINLMNRFVVPLLTSLAPWLATLIVTGLMVFLITYVVMPRITKLFAKWLYPKATG
jgi:uncharacterized protein